MTDAIETALRHPTCPTSVLNSLLNMAEYMDQTEHPLHLQLDIHNLGGCALRTRTYAKALHCAFYNFLDHHYSFEDPNLTQRRTNYFFSVFLYYYYSVGWYINNHHHLLVIFCLSFHLFISFVIVHFSF